MATPTPPAAPTAVWTRHGQRWTLDVVGLGLACCAVELLAASFDPPTPPPSAPLPRASVLVVAGTVTHGLAPGVVAAHAALAGDVPVAVLAFGVCAISGGPYWDSHVVVPGTHRLLPVDVVVPGCPPRPEALHDGLRRVEDALDVRLGGAR